VGCRQRGLATELVCLVLREGAIAAAPRRGRSGRGAWLHANQDCVTAAIKTRAFGRAFRAAAPPLAAGDLWALVVASRRPLS
jgi:predicted RNA-binding protein YlxR (DUF448 family)